ncbi:hypothetical protein ACWDN6_20010, partial [Streptomyces albogriseolus]
VPVTEKADRANPGHVAAPFAGVVTLAGARTARRRVRAVHRPFTAFTHVSPSVGLGTLQPRRSTAS